MSWHPRKVGGVMTAAHGGTLRSIILLLELVPERRFAMAILTNHSNGWRLIQDVEREGPAHARSHVPRSRASHRSSRTERRCRTFVCSQHSPDPAPYVGRSRMSWMDLKLGLRMLVKYPGLTIAGGLAIAIAIGLGAGWYDVSRDFFRPTIPLPEGDRIVEIEMRNPRIVGDERRLLHDFMIWRQELKSVEELGAYRTLERLLSVGRANPEPVTVAEISASAFQLVRVPPILGRPLIEADEAPGAPGVVVLGYHVWQQRFGGGADVIGQNVQLGRATSTVVGVMPEGFAFPINHRMWVPLPLRPSGYAPLEGAPVRIFGRIAKGATQEHANDEVTAITDRVRASSPHTRAPAAARACVWG